MNKAVVDNSLHRLRFVQCALLALVFTAGLSCTPRLRTLRHDPSVAARAAQEFAEAAFVERNFKQAHTSLSNEMRHGHKAQEIEAMVAKIHPVGYPATVVATEFEPMPGQAAMNVFLVGEAESEKFYYRLVMSGTVDEGYTVSGFWRGSGPYPPAKLRQPLPR